MPYRFIRLLKQAVLSFLIAFLSVSNVFAYGTFPYNETEYRIQHPTNMRIEEALYSLLEIVSEPHATLERLFEGVAVLHEATQTVSKTTKKAAVKTLTLTKEKKVTRVPVREFATPQAPVTVVSPTASTVPVKTSRTSKDLSTYGFSLEVKDDSQDHSGVMSQASIDSVENVLSDTLSSLPSDHYASLKKLTLNTARDGGRGLGGARTIILRIGGLPQDEIAGVLVHELGHVTDLGYLAVTDASFGVDSQFFDGVSYVSTSDPSFYFYSIAWDDAKNKRAGMGDTSFVTGYAMSDPFEDFAETYTYYILHAKEFRAMAQSNDTLAQKYLFIKNTVFSGKEFDTGREGISVTERQWDATRVPYNLTAFLNR